ncbi:MAG: hypothetical protein P4L49_16895 [Desulfosporosinus sp.]|nr:hypothetical protein [Desulfosporosinus sp.]
MQINRLFEIVYILLNKNQQQATVDWAEEEMRKGSTLAASPWAANTAAQIEAYRKNGTDVVLRNAPCLIVAVASKDRLVGRNDLQITWQ